VREGWVRALALSELDLPSVAPSCARRERLPSLWSVAFALREVSAVERRRLGAADERVLLLRVSATLLLAAQHCGVIGITAFARLRQAFEQLIAALNVVFVLDQPGFVVEFELEQIAPYV